MSTLGSYRLDLALQTVSYLQASLRLPAHISAAPSHLHLQEHCLMGIRGQLRRSQDGHVIHSNVDTDVIVSEELPSGSTRKPEELYSIIERFCLGMR